MVSLADRVATALRTHSPDLVEAALVAGYCHANTLTPAPGSATADACAVPVPAALTAVLAGTGPTVPDEVGPAWTLDALVSAFETLLEADVAAASGAVFTPAAITAFMAAELCARAAARGVDLTTATVIDPAVGCGALLVATIAELCARTGQPASVVAGRVHGVDVDPDSLHRARLLIELCCLSLGDPTAPAPRLVHADTLRPATHPDGGLGRHPLVIANPPYVRYQDLPQDRRTELAADWEVCGAGNFNLYFPFLAATRDLATADGVVAVIAPNGYFTSLAGTDLRRWLAGTRFLDTIVDFGHRRVFNAMTYTAITFSTPKPAGDDPDGETGAGFSYVDVDGLEDLATLPADPSWETTRGTAVSWARLEARRWSLVGPRQRGLIDVIETAGRPLSQVAMVRFGVATCRDGLYRLDGDRDDQGRYLARYDGRVWPIEAAVTRRCVKVSGVTTPEQLASYRGRILYPYRVRDGVAHVLAEEQLAEDYPGAYAYLCAIRDELAGRDRGRKTYAAWFAYGRTQGLVPYGPRLLTPLYASVPRFLLDDDAESLFLNGCSVTPVPEAGTDLETLGWVLNSGVCRLYVQATANAISNGFFAYQKKQLAGFGVPDLTGDQRAALRAVAAAGDLGGVDDLVADAYGMVLPAEYRRASPRP